MTGLWTLVLAGALHTGVPVRGVAGVGEPSFVAPSEGWTASIDGGLLRVFVGRAEGDAADWVARQRALLVRAPEPLPGLGDEAWGDGDGLVLFRDGNVGVLVRAPAEARALAERVRAALVDDGSAWPRGPALVAGEGAWTLPVSQGYSVMFRGGLLANQPGWTFTALPDEIFVWDPWGRAAAVSIPR